MAVASPEKPKTAGGATGKVIAITGPVVDIEFPSGQLPAIFNAVRIERDGSPLVCEGQPPLGNDWGRTGARTRADGLPRGAEAVDTGAPISIPVGPGTLGRVFNVL